MSKEKVEYVEFPEVSDLDMAFGGIPERQKFEKLAQENGFDFMNGNKYSSYAMNLFYTGGKFPPRRVDVSEEYYRKGIRYFHCWLGSFKPKHESKEEVCGYILSLITDLEKEDTIQQKLKKTIEKILGKKKKK